MLEISTLKEYLGMPPDAADTIAELCLKTAKSKCRTADIPDFQNNAHYDLFLCALSSCWYDNRGLTFAGNGNASAEDNARRLVNSFVLELRYAEEDKAYLAITAGENTTVSVFDSDSNVYEDGADFVVGTVLTITATADDGYTLTTFTVNDVTAVSPYVHTVSGDVTIVTAATEEGV
jgi:hypothetical protein